MLKCVEATPKRHTRLSLLLSSANTMSTIWYHNWTCDTTTAVAIVAVCCPVEATGVATAICGVFVATGVVNSVGESDDTATGVAVATTAACGGSTMRRASPMQRATDTAREEAQDRWLPQLGIG